jgi:hypothetical protein
MFVLTKGEKKENMNKTLEHGEMEKIIKKKMKTKHKIKLKRENKKGWT